MCNKAKQQYLDEETDEVQKDDFCQPEQAHQRFRKLPRKLRVRNTVKGLKDANGNTLTEKDEIAKRWRKCRKHLYSDLPVEFSDPLSDNPITKNEVSHAMRHMKANEAAGQDDLALEKFQKFGADVLHMLTSLFNDLY